MNMDVQDGVIGGVIVLFISAVLRKTVLATAINQFYSADTESWGLATIIAWEVLPTLVIAVFFIISIQSVRSQLN